MGGRWTLVLLVCVACKSADKDPGPPKPVAPPAPDAASRAAEGTEEELLARSLSVEETEIATNTRVLVRDPQGHVLLFRYADGRFAPLMMAASSHLSALEAARKVAAGAKLSDGSFLREGIAIDGTRWFFADGPASENVTRVSTSTQAGVADHLRLPIALALNRVPEVIDALAGAIDRDPYDLHPERHRKNRTPAADAKIIAALHAEHPKELAKTWQKQLEAAATFEVQQIDYVAADTVKLDVARWKQADPPEDALPNMKLTVIVRGGKIVRIDQ